MTTPKIKETSALDTVWREATFTHARLEAEALTRELSPPFEAFAQDALAIHNEQRTHWKAELLAQAQVVALSGATDAWCARLEKDALMAFDLDRANKTFRLLFPEGLARVTKRALASQLDVMRGWSAILESAPALAAHAPALAELLTRGDAALRARAEAETQTALHRLKRIEALIHTLNAARDAAYADLLKLAVTHGKPKGWARSFFGA